MDLLDKYKKTWSNQPEEAHKLSKVEIYKMAHSKSTSIVKWIFIIGLLEFLIIIPFLFIETDAKHFEEMNVLWLHKTIDIVSCAIVAFFVIKFYLNYRSISSLDNTKTLMDKIVKTRRTVRNYIFTGLSFISILILMMAFSSINNQFNNETPIFKIGIIAIFIFIGAIFLGLFWLFYQLIYGILLKKLNKNYKELAKLDELN
jgi:amino acid transporter